MLIGECGLYSNLFIYTCSLTAGNLVKLLVSALLTVSTERGMLKLLDLTDFPVETSSFTCNFGPFFSFLEKVLSSHL